MAHGRPAVPRTGSEKSEIRAGAQRTLLQSQETDRHQGHARATERASALASMNPLVPPPSGRPQGFHTAWKAGTHNHRRLLEQKPLATVPKARPQRMGPRVRAG